MVTNNMRAFTLLFLSGLLFFSCSKSTADYIINEWDIEDIDFLTEKDKTIEEIEKVFKNDSYITVNKDHKYFIHTPTVNYGGTWFYSKDDKNILYTVNSEGDTIANKIETLTKDKLVFLSDDPKMQMRFSLVPRK
jgi:hypothetical protein